MMYSAGGAHPLRDACIAVLELVEADRIEAVTSAEVVQEIFHRFATSERADEGRELASATLDLFSPVLAIDHEVMGRMPDLTRRYASHTARDLIHVATCLRYDIGLILSPDTDFDEVNEVRRVDPGDEDAVAGLLA